ncbi:hypothetical protein [Streptosporangium roseum]|nr:hypothetical protein [Streptosporangium roseum]
MQATSKEDGKKPACAKSWRTARRSWTATVRLREGRVVTVGGTQGVPEL